MIEFKTRENKVILSYSSYSADVRWVYDKLDKYASAKIIRIFSCTKNELIPSFDERHEDSSVEFVVAVKKGPYYCFSKDILSLKHDLYIHESMELKEKLFVATRGISIFKRIDSLVNYSIYIGGANDSENSISAVTFAQLLKDFPNGYELKMYASARIGSILSPCIGTKVDDEGKYQKYMNKRVTRKGENLNSLISETELLKYEDILKKLNSMLSDENSYSEVRWQEELLEIVLLLHPKYLHIFKEVSVRDTYNNTYRKIDYLLVDSSGNTDIIEIKKPFDKCIVTERTYRDNHIPLKELSGTVMQIEKYIFYLNKWGKNGEDKLTERYKDKIGPKFNIKITNPSGIIVMGRTKGLSKEQIQDFEVIKRKYKNVIDIITYDDLIERLQFTINHWTEQRNKSPSLKTNKP